MNRLSKTGLAIAAILFVLSTSSSMAGVGWWSSLQAPIASLDSSATPPSDDSEGQVLPTWRELVVRELVLFLLF